MKGRPKSTYDPRKKNWYCDDPIKLEIFRRRNPDISVSEFFNRQLDYELQTDFSNPVQKRTVLVRRIRVISIAREKAHDKVDTKFDIQLKPLLKEIEKMNKREAKTYGKKTRKSN